MTMLQRLFRAAPERAAARGLIGGGDIQIAGLVRAAICPHSSSVGRPAPVATR
jgi:hypothetical protein